MNTILPDDDFYWIDFVEEYEDIPSGNDINPQAFWEKFNNQLSRVLARVEIGKGYYLKKDAPDHLQTMVTKGELMTELYVPVNIVYDKKTGQPDVEWTWLPWGKLLKLTVDGMGKAVKINTYGSETFEPNKPTTKLAYNSWKGFKASRVSPDFQFNKDRIKPILNFFREILCNDDEKMYKYLMSWVHHILTKPEQKTETCIYFYSKEHGTGKGSFCNFMRMNIIGSSMASEIQGLNLLTQKHNTIIAKKLFIACDETSTLKGDYHTTFDNLKNMITSPTCNIEPKGVDPYEIPNRVNLCIMSNNLYSIKQEQGDRRYVCFEVNPKKVINELDPDCPNADYWCDLNKNYLNDEGAQHFYYYICNEYPKEDLVNLRKIPRTELKDQMVNFTKPLVDRFIDDITNEEFKIKENLKIGPITVTLKKETKTETIQNAFKKSVVYQEFERYCDVNNEAKMTRKNFLANFLPKIPEVRKHNVLHVVLPIPVQPTPEEQPEE